MENNMNERKEKALNLAASWWGQWQWYEIRRPVLWALVRGQECLGEYYNNFIGAAAIIEIAFGMSGEEITDYCKQHVDYLLDDHALDDDTLFPQISVWIDGVKSVSDEYPS